MHKCYLQYSNEQNTSMIKLLNSAFYDYLMVPLRVH